MLIYLKMTNHPRVNTTCRILIRNLLNEHWKKVNLFCRDVKTTPNSCVFKYTIKKA